MIRRFRGVGLALLLALLLTTGVVYGAGLAQRAVFGWVMADRLTVYPNNTEIQTLTANGAASFNSTVDIDGAISSGAGAITLTDASGVVVTTGGLSLSDGDLVVADDLRVTAQTVISVTDGGTITPTGTYQPIQSAGTVTPTLIVTGTAGDLLVLINTTATSIVFVDSGNLVMSGNATLGQYDTLTLWADGTRWIEIAQVDN